MNMPTPTMWLVFATAIMMFVIPVSIDLIKRYHKRYRYFVDVYGVCSATNVTAIVAHHHQSPYFAEISRRTYEDYEVIQKTKQTLQEILTLHTGGSDSNE